jgi:plastocyanin
MRSLLSLTAVLAVIGCSSGSSYNSVTGTPNPGPPPPPVTTTSVDLRNLAFSPRAIQVTPGATVQFTNDDGIQHNITFSSGSVSDPIDFSTGSRSVVMPTATGTYAYHCTIHAGMTGTILVQ